MENPATWTPLHHELNNAYYHSTDGVKAVLTVFHTHNYRVTLNQIESIINRFKEQMQLHICGLSLPSMLVQELAKEEYI